MPPKTVSIFILTSVLIVVFLVLLALPINWHAKVVGSIGSLAAVFVAYGIYSAAIDFENNLSKQNDPANEMVFMDMQKLMSSTPELQSVYKEIFGNQINPEKHSLVTIMAIRIQEANKYYKLTDLSILPNNPLITTLKAWANSPTFKSIWPSIKKYYDPSTDKLISMLQL